MVAPTHQLAQVRLYEKVRLRAFRTRARATVTCRDEACAVAGAGRQLTQAGPKNPPNPREPALAHVLNKWTRRERSCPTSRPYRQMTGSARFRSTAGSHRRSIGS